VSSSAVGTLQSGLRSQQCPKLPSIVTDSCSWYAAYTYSNHEKCVATQLGLRSIKYFLPLYDAVHRWKDRRVKLQLPVFPGYVFVRLNLTERLNVVQIPGVARLVSFNGRPCALPDSEIEAIQICLLEKINCEPHAYLEAGRRVRIKAGPLEGFEGIVIGRKNRLRFIISLGLIHRSACVTVEAGNIQAL
jgi:transcription antitermination factor NusG